MSVSRRQALIATSTLVTLAFTGCSSSPPVDQDAVNRVVREVEGVTRVDIKVETNGGVSGWFLTGEVGLPDDRGRALTVYDNCLRAIASLEDADNRSVLVYVVGRSASGELNPDDVGAPDDTRSLVEHYQ